MMLSLTRSIFPITGRIRKVKPVVNLVFGQSNPYSKHNIFAFSTSRSKNENDSVAHEAHPNKTPLAEKIRGLHRKARPLALPNLISGSRLALAPMTGYFIMNNMYPYALVCIAAAAFTDVADKVVAKMLDYNSDIHVKLDYVADKTLLVTAMICLCEVDIMPVWMLKGLIIRELIFVFGSLIIRYGSFGETPSARKYFDFHNHPMLGLEPSYSGRILTGSQYTLCAYSLYLASQGSSLSAWPLFSLQLFTALMSSLTLGSGYNSLSKPEFVSRPVKS